MRRLLVSLPERFARALVVAAKWLLVLFAVFVSIVIVPIVELGREIAARVRRLFAGQR